MRKYRDVIEADGEIVGQRTLGPDSDLWVTFRASRDLLHISEALDRYPGELGYDDGPIWQLQDGYGVPGHTPPQGWDWSGIRDSSPKAIKAMVEVARQYFTDDDLDRLLGLQKGDSMTGFRIYTVDTGVGSDVYEADSYSYETEGLRPDGSGVTIVVFRAKNGPDRGKVTKMPVHRVDRIVNMSLPERLLGMEVTG